MTIPFTRMLAGPMDFTPGAFRNAARGRFQIKDVEPMSQGTRAHQLAMYVVYDAPLVMLAIIGGLRKARLSSRFIEKVPHRLGRHQSPERLARKIHRHGPAEGRSLVPGRDDQIGRRDLTVPLDFLAPGAYEAGELTSPTARTRPARAPASIETKPFKAGDNLAIHLAPGGGWPSS